MATKLVVTLPDKTFEQIEKQAQVENRPIGDLVVDVLQSTFNIASENPEQGAMGREMAAYQAMHKKLLMQYENQYVAIYGGQVVDHDRDQLALVKRRLKNYPNEIVMITQVRPEPIRTLHFRSPRLARSVS
jgi:hypothetical protein